MASLFSYRVVAAWVIPCWTSEASGLFWTVIILFIFTNPLGILGDQYAHQLGIGEKAARRLIDNLPMTIAMRNEDILQGTV